MVRHKMLPPTLSTIGRNEPSRLSCSIPGSILGNLRSEQTFSWILRLAFPAVSLAEPNPPLPFLPLIEVSFASPSTWLIPFKNPQLHLVDGLLLPISTFKPCVSPREVGSPWWLSHMLCSVDPWVLYPSSCGNRMVTWPLELWKLKPREDLLEWKVQLQCAGIFASDIYKVQFYIWFAKCDRCQTQI